MRSQQQVGAYIGPAAVGAAYAVSKTLLLQSFAPGSLSQIDFYQLFLLGILLGFVIRPVAQRVFWNRSAAFFILSLLLCVLGPGRLWLGAYFWQQNMDLWNPMALIECVALMAAMGITALVMPPQQVTLNLPWFLQKAKKQKSLAWLLRILLMAGVYAGGQYGLHGMTSMGLWYWSGLFLQGSLLVLAFQPLFWVIYGRVYELTLILTLLLFICSDFLPHFFDFVDAPLEEVGRLFLQMLIFDLFFCYGLAFFFAKPPRRADD